MSHGLPVEYRTPEGTKESLEAVLGYLQALEKANYPIVVAIFDERMKIPRSEPRLSQQIGYLRALPGLPSAPEVHRFGLYWPDTEQPSGEFSLDERLFEGGTLGTFDGDSFFGLALDFGAYTLKLLDANTDMDHAVSERSKRQKRQYLDLPTAKELEEKWRDEPNQDYIKALRAEIAELREQLVNDGASAAKEMSDEEISAAAIRVKWRILERRRSGADVGPHPGPWIEELTRDLKTRNSES
jgi:hypothetical protein